MRLESGANAMVSGIEPSGVERPAGSSATPVGRRRGSGARCAQPATRARAMRRSRRRKARGSAGRDVGARAPPHRSMVGKRCGTLTVAGSGVKTRTRGTVVVIRTRKCVRATLGQTSYHRAGRMRRPAASRTPRAVRHRDAGGSDERVRVSLPRSRAAGVSPGRAADHAEVDELAPGPEQEGPHQGSGSAARGDRQGGARPAEDRHGRSLRGVQGPGGRLHARRGQGSGGGGGALEGLPDLRAQRVRGSAAGHEDVVDPVDSLFRRESGRMVAVLTRIFGVHNLALAEDVVQDAFCHALEVWKFRGYPERPSAWLMTAAKNRAIDVLRRERTARTFAPELTRLLDSEWTLVPTIEEQFAPSAVQDDLLRMMFSCCHPRLKEEAQVALVLHILCGFSVREVAGAFVATHAAIEKRITRAKKVLADSQHLFDVARAEEFSARLPAVQRALYLLFNEGYHGASAESVVRGELCGEAMRLAALLEAHPFGATPATRALSALMCLHAARLPARIDAAGDLHSLF